MYCGRMCRAQGEVTLMFSCRIWFSWAGFLGPGHVRLERVPARAEQSLCSTCSAAWRGLRLWRVGMWAPPTSRGKDSALCARDALACQAHSGDSWTRPSVSKAALVLSLFLVLLVQQWAWVPFIWILVPQSVWAPAVPCALLPWIKESQSFAVPDSSAGMKHELQLKCENTISATETNCTWCLGKDKFLASCANVLISPVHSAV